MNEAEYTLAASQAVNAVQDSGAEWNQKYLDALEAHGLELVPFNEDFEPGYYIEAPLPVPDQSPSWERSLIVPKQAAEEQQQTTIT